ncbi:peptidoglycan amidohydrolase family protein [Streptococcus uberis]
MTDSIQEMRRLQSIPVKYDMGDRYGNDADRDGRIEMDCSSAVSKALGISMTNNTESLQSVLPTIGYPKIFDAVDGTFDMQAYDVIIWAPRDGSSSLGAFGHVLIATSPTTAIHCNYGSDGITENDYNYIWNLNGRPREIVFRKGATPQKSKPTEMSAFDKELDVNTRLTVSDKPYYEATLSEDYYVESGPRIDSQDKELIKAGTRVRVYEKLNGWSRINHPESSQWVEDAYLVDATDM